MKLSFLGSGKIGAAIAYTAAGRGLADEIAQPGWGSCSRHICLWTAGFAFETTIDGLNPPGYNDPIKR